LLDVESPHQDHQVFAMKYSGSLLSFGGRNFSLHPTWKSTNQPPGNQVEAIPVVTDASAASVIGPKISLGGFS
jgi:hypothetical protein